MISVIIPTFNHGTTIRELISFVKANTPRKFLEEIIVVDGGSIDQTRQEVERAGAVLLLSETPNRARQLNLGARQARGQILYFLKADTFPPENFAAEIIRATQKGFYIGSFSLSFNYHHWLLKPLCWLTRRTGPKIHFNDQSLFITRSFFEKSNGFREDYGMLEEYELIHRLKKYSRFTVLKECTRATAKRFVRHGILWTEFVYTLLYLLYRGGYPQKTLLKIKGLCFSQTKEHRIMSNEKAMAGSST